MGAPSSLGLPRDVGTWVPWCGDLLLGLPGQLLQFGLGIVQAVALHVLMRGVRQELVQRQDVSGDLRGRGGEAGERWR